MEDSNQADTHYYFLTVNFNQSYLIPSAFQNNLSHRSLAELSSKHPHNSRSTEGAIVTQSVCLLTIESLSFRARRLFFLFPAYLRGGLVEITQRRGADTDQIWENWLENGPLNQSQLRERKIVAGLPWSSFKNLMNAYEWEKSEGLSCGLIIFCTLLCKEISGNGINRVMTGLVSYCWTDFS